MDEPLLELRSKEEVDYVLQAVDDLLVIIRIGRTAHMDTERMDGMLQSTAPLLANMATVWHLDEAQVPVYAQYFGIQHVPALVFFYNGQHIKCDYGTPDHSKWVGLFHCKQDFIDLVEVVYRGAIHGKFIVTSPVPKERTPSYSLLYADV